MSVCCCSLAGTAACQHCSQNPFATDVWTNKTVTVNHVEAKPFGNGLDVCPVCGKPSTILKPMTNYDRLISKTPEELARFVTDDLCELFCGAPSVCDGNCEGKMLAWLKATVEEADE